MRSAHELNGPTFAHAILTARELMAALASPDQGPNASAAIRSTASAERLDLVMCPRRTQGANP
jgi:hypothetical protein